MTSSDTDHTPQRSRTWFWSLGLFVGLVLVMVWALPKHVQAGDAGEFSTVMLAGGVPHPSGYPWMRLLGHVATAIRALGLGPATSAAIPCAVAGVLGWVGIHRVALHWVGGDKPVAVSQVAATTIAVALVSTSSLVVVHVNDCEVWGPLLAFSAVVMMLALRRADPLVLGLSLGLAVSHHLTAILLLPLVVAAAWPRGATVARVAAVAGRGLLGSALGLTPYLTLALGSNGAWRWGDPTSAAGLARHVLRADYGVFQLSLHTETVHEIDLLARVGRSLAATFSAGVVTHAGLGWVLFAIIVVVSSRLALRRHPRRDVVGLGLSALACAIGFPLLHNINPQSPFGRFILERFDILTVAVLTPMFALLLAWPLKFAQKPVIRVLLGVVAVTLLARQLIGTAWAGVPADNSMVEGYARDLLRTPDPGQTAIVIGTDDHRTFPVLYAQAVLGEGQNVLYIDASLFTYQWYRQGLKTRFPDLPEAAMPLRLVGALWDDPRWRDTPVYFANVFSAPAKTYPTVPQGVLWRLVPPHQANTPPQLSQIETEHRAAFSRYVVKELPIGRASHPFAGDLSGAYTEGTWQLASALRASGQNAKALTLLEDLAIPPES